MRVSTAGFLPTLKANLSWNWNMAQVDIMCWLPLAAHVIHTFMKGDSVVHADTDSGFAMIGAGSHAPYFPASITLSTALFQMIKFERYIHGFKILNRVLEKSQGVLMVGGAAAAVVLVFSSTMMYYAERNNPDPNMNKYYDSVPMAMWVTLLNLSGEVPLCDYTTVGSIIVGALSISACAIFAIPVGALGSGFEAVISEITSEQEAHENAEEENPLLPVTNPAAAGTGGGTEMTKYGARLVEGRGPRGERFMLISLIATLFAVSLEVWSTVDYAALLVVVAWFTIEYIVRTSANGSDYTFSQLGAIDFVSTFPYFAAKGLLGSSIADTMDVYDGPLRALRILRLVRLDSYVPSLTLIDDAVRNCWAGLSVAMFAGAVIWFQFNEMLYFAESGDKTEGEEKRFRNALSSLQYSGILITGDYPLVDFSLYGRLCCTVAVVAEKRRAARYEAASKMQNIFLKRKANGKSSPSKFANLVKDVMKNSAQLPIWKNNLHTDHENSYLCGISGVGYRGFMVKLIFANIAAVILESIPEVEKLIPHFYWQTFETLSVLIFTTEYLINVGCAKFDPAFGFSRYQYMTTFIGKADLVSILPFFVQTIIIPFIFGADSVYNLDATVFRIVRLARVLEFEIFFESFTLLGEVFNKAGPVLKATGVLALILWVGGATAFYYADPHNDSEVNGNGGEDPAVFTSIVDALYYTSIFMAGEWCVSDFTPAGSVICVVMAMVGVALFSIPVGVLFEGFQDMLEERHGKKEESNDEDDNKKD
eukprot:GSChrysophyteH2.ASY1.ANO1.921.1 assembled CDS